MKFRHDVPTKFKRKRWPKILLVAIAFVVLVGVGAAIGLHQTYNRNLRAVNSAETADVIVTVPSGASVKAIATILKEKDLIRQTWAFERYIQSEELGPLLKAGTYRLKQSQSVQEIANALVDGKVASDLVTFLPGQRIDQIKNMLIEQGYSATAVSKALDPATYKNHPALVDKPPKASLEGYIYPESFHKTAETSPETLVRAALDELQSYLTPDLRAAFANQGLSTHEAITLASIVEKEVSSQEDRAKVAQVFLLRLKQGMALGADPTAPYGAILAGQPPTLGYDSPYNTHTHVGLPPGPISNVTASSLRAVANPAKTDYVYFVSGDDGVTHFSHTQEEHETLTAKYCKKLCGGGQ